MPSRIQTAKTIELKSYAKINLCLRITGKYEDGYHSLSSVFIEIDLHDNIYITPSKSMKLLIEGTDYTSDKNNTIIKITYLMKEKFSLQDNFAITVEKNIPYGAGLGGGSSNAAAIIKFLNMFYDLKLSNKQMEEIALYIGCDVPFFIRGGLQLVEGRGEILTPIKVKFPYTFLIVYPGINISTKWAYTQFDLTKKSYRHKFDTLFNSDGFNFELFENQFEDIVFQTHPEVGRIKQELLKSGAIYAGLSGSGSTVFGIYENIASAKEVEKNFKNFHTSIALPRY